ncbi:HNH endonuclease [Virgisporangium aurantiacum]|uniref:HNH nuclease domain-containing protein n=1 Tax=Virgisporangium aurantiacum TaxID=175570 RepID=A0A8J3Z3U3_9ACTN|nr:HNH endonuclease [Virgisporangium aurantiacum]GIJ55803.1 hypothetical protein Vau01_033190 [Virgisporangium aurantiacum]
MALSGITRHGVLAAIEEFDRLGREEFLAKYRFGKALSYFVYHNGKFYDSKAIAGYAHGEIAGESRWTTDDFTGGEASVARHLRDRLGFEFIVQTVDWTRDELVLACDLVWANDWHELRAEYPQVIELSALLRRYWASTLERRETNFRSPNSVGRKTSDIATQHPDHKGRPTRGGKLDRLVLAEFMANPQALHEEAMALRAAIVDGETLDITAARKDEVDVESGAQEGRLLEQRSLRYERKPALRNRTIKAFKKKYGFVACEACRFDFSKFYGLRGEGFIECHHRTPLSQSGVTETMPGDLILLCSNCHRMVHCKRPWLTVAQLLDLVRTNGATP